MLLPASLTAVTLLAGGALFLSGYSMGRQAAAEPGTPGGEGGAFRPFWDTYHTIRDRYAGGDVSRDAIVQGAIRGMINSLEDPYSQYLSPTSTARACRGSAANSRASAPSSRPRPRTARRDA